MEHIYYHILSPKSSLISQMGSDHAQRFQQDF